jgi:hypothetical protein
VSHTARGLAVHMEHWPSATLKVPFSQGALPCHVLCTCLRNVKVALLHGLKEPRPGM